MTENESLFKIGIAWLRKFARYSYIASAWLMFASVLILIFLAGMMLFVSTRYTDTNIGAGWTSHLPILLLIITGVASWLPRRLVGWFLIVVVVHTVQLALPLMKGDQPFIAAFHPLNAMLLAWVSLKHAQLASAMLIQRTPGNERAGEPILEPS